MAISLHIRDLPDPLHQTLTHRAARSGTSLRQYAIRVLAEHCALPTVEEWLAEVRALPSTPVATRAADVVEAARDEDDREVLGAQRRR